MTRWKSSIGLTTTDKSALNRALQTILRGADKARAQQVAAMIRERGWEAAATFAASVLQFASLGLKPWDTLPCEADPSGADPADRLLAKMIAADLSRYEPDPISALTPSAPDRTAQDAVLDAAVSPTGPSRKTRLEHA